jgi:S-disulfanyl-L-cysteine oxidoreductase SoxD
MDRRGTTVAVLLLLAISAAGIKAQDSTGSTNDGIYTEAQAERGKIAYAKFCQSCHAETLAGIDSAPPLAGSAFLSNWSGQSVADLTARMRTSMPLNNPGTLSAATTTDIISFILKSNGYVAGKAELPHDDQFQQTIHIDAPKPAG